MKKIQSGLIILTIIFGGSMAFGQCLDTSNIYTFTYNSQIYEVVRENKTWSLASACAVERGGMLAEINDSTEQNAVYSEVLNNASITPSNTVAPDGGGASYVWIGGNDFATEGDWIWDGNNDLSGTQFWMGTSSGTPVGGLYNNWGNEPDDFGTGQDGLGLAITDWPLGISGQWNDVDDANSLYYVIEYPSTAGIIFQQQKNVTIYPVPTINNVTIEAEIGMKTIELFTITGELINTIEANNSIHYILEISDLKSGTYLLRILLENNEIATRKIVR